MKERKREEEVEDVCSHWITLREDTVSWKRKEEIALFWRVRFGSVCGHVARQTT